MTVLRIEKAGDTGVLDGGLSLLFTTSAWNFCGEFYFRLFTVCSTFLRIRPTPRKALTFQRCWNGFFKFTLSLITIKLFIVFIPLVRNRTVSYIEIIFRGLFALQSHLSFLREIARINRGKQFQLRKLCKNWLVLGGYNHYRQFFLDESENVLKVYFGILYSCEYCGFLTSNISKTEIYTKLWNWRFNSPFLENIVFNRPIFFKLRTSKIQMHAIDTVYRQICEEWRIIDITKTDLRGKILHAKLRTR